MTTIYELLELERHGPPCSTLFFPYKRKDGTTRNVMCVVPNVDVESIPLPTFFAQQWIPKLKEPA